MIWLAERDVLEHSAAVPRAELRGLAMAEQLRSTALGLTKDFANPGSGLAVGMADALTVLWAGFHRFDSADPRWPDRDRFVVSPGHGAPLLYALLHLTGHAGMDATALATYRQPGSPCTAHPDAMAHPAIEATTGPLGQGFGMAVGMALAERLLAARFGKSLVDHRTWVLATLGDLMEGISHEAASLAGHLRLEKLFVLLEDDTDCAACASGLAGPDDAVRRFAALGWATRSVNAHDPAAIEAALALAARARRPTLLACRTARTGPWLTPPLQERVAAQWAEVGHRGSAARRGWLKRLARHPLRAEFERVVAGRLPDDWSEQLAAVRAPLATRRSPASSLDTARRLLEALAPEIPELVGGQTEFGPTRNPPVTPGSFSGRHVHYGPREHGMASCLSGLALHGGLLPSAASSLAATDAMLPALRLSAQMGLRAIHVATHESGADGAAAQSLGQLTSLRTIPNLLVLRPADAVETAECCELAVRRANGPSLLVLSAQPLPALRIDQAENRSARGAYVLAEANGPRQATLIASGSEVAVAMQARDCLMAEGIAAAVVSMPAWSLFAEADLATRTRVLGNAPRFGIEAACGFGWERWLGEDGVFLGLSGLGAFAPAPDSAHHFGLTAGSITVAVKRRLNDAR